MDLTQIITIIGALGISTAIGSSIALYFSARRSRFEELSTIVERQGKELERLDDKMEKKDAEITRLSVTVEQLEIENGKQHVSINVLQVENQTQRANINALQEKNKQLIKIIEDYGIDIKRGRHKGLLKND